MFKYSNFEQKLANDRAELSLIFLHPFKSRYLIFALYVAISNTDVSPICEQSANAKASKLAHFLTNTETQLFFICL